MNIMLWRLPVGRYADIPVYLHWSWLVMITIITILNWQFALVLAGVFFVVLLHEFGHCAAALAYGHKTKEITLTPVGGLAILDIKRISHRQELFISLAGPAVNVFLFFPLVYLSAFHPILMMIAVYNTIIFLFNMIPCFPMDGGRVLRALLGMAFGDLNGTYYAVRIGQVIGCLFCIFGFYNLALTLPIIGLMAILYSENEWQNKKMQAIYGRISEETNGMEPKDALAHAAKVLKEKEPWIYTMRSIEERRVREED